MWSTDRKILEEMEMASATSVFAAGLNVKGDIEAVSDIRIEGDVKGNVTTKKKACCRHIRLRQRKYFSGGSMCNG
jgi:cytoskeletal protein CcmA (bactofilin family)